MSMTKTYNSIIEKYTGDVTSHHCELYVCEDGGYTIDIESIAENCKHEINLKFHYSNFDSNCGLGIIQSIVFDINHPKVYQILNDIFRATLNKYEKYLLLCVTTDDDKKLIEYLMNSWRLICIKVINGKTYKFWEVDYNGDE